MKKATAITCVFLDIGGVVLTDGWDHHARKRAATNFKLDLAEMEDRHHLTFDTYEEGKLTLEEYLGRVVFYEERPFTPDQFRKFMFAQSKPYPKMIELVRRLSAAVRGARRPAVRVSRAVVRVSDGRTDPLGWRGSGRRPGRPRPPRQRREPGGGSSRQAGGHEHEFHSDRRGADEHPLRRSRSRTVLVSGAYRGP